MDMIDKIKTEMENQGVSMGELARRMSGSTVTRKKDLSEILNRKRDPGRLLLEEISRGLEVDWIFDSELKWANHLLNRFKGSDEYKQNIEFDYHLRTVKRVLRNYLERDGWRLIVFNASKGNSKLGTSSIKFDIECEDLDLRSELWGAIHKSFGKP